MGVYIDMQSEPPCSYPRLEFRLRAQATVKNKNKKNGVTGSHTRILRAGRESFVVEALPGATSREL